MSIRTKLAVSFSVTALFLLAVGCAAVWFIRQLNAVLDDARYYGQQMELIADAMAGLHQDPSATAQHLARLNDAERLARTQDEREKMREARVKLTQGHSLLATDGILNDLGDYYRRSTVTAHDKLLILHEQAVMATIAAIACGVFLLIIIMQFVRYWLLYPVVLIHRTVDRISAGDTKQRLNFKRKDEVGQLATSINQMAGTMEEYATRTAETDRLAAAGEAVTFVAQNINGPLNSIRTLAQYERAAPTVTPDSRAAFDHISIIVSKLERWTRHLVNSVRPLQTSRAHQPLETVALDALGLIRSQIDEKSLVLEINFPETLPNLYLDTALVEQALVAVYYHAVEASRSEGKLLLQAAHQGNGTITLDVHYQTPEVNHEHPAGAPYRPAATSDLKITLARKIFEAHDGSLDLDHPSPHGLSVRITLPATAPNNKKPK